MKQKTVKKILDAWEMFETAEPDISTERLTAMTADYCKCDYDDVIEALAIENQREKP